MDFNIFHLRPQTNARFYKKKKGGKKFRAKEFSLAPSLKFRL